MLESAKTTLWVTKVPTKYRDGRLRYWCNHCKNAHDTKTVLERHYDERHPEHLDAERSVWKKQSYAQTRHSGNESDSETEEEPKDTYDDQSDESDDGEGIQVGALPQQGDEKSDDENASARMKIYSAAEQARIYFDLAAHADLGLIANVLEFARRGMAKLREADKEHEGGRMDTSQDLSDVENGVKDEDINTRGARGRLRQRKKVKKKDKEDSKTHPVAKASWNMMPYNG